MTEEEEEEKPWIYDVENMSIQDGFNKVMEAVTALGPFIDGSDEAADWYGHLSIRLGVLLGIVHREMNHE